MAPLDAGPGAGLLALAVLVLLPGLLVVRAPWPAVPFLSLSFWALSWGWLFGASRERFLRAALLSFFLLALLRLLKPLGLRRPSGATALVLGSATLPLVACFTWELCPGAEMSFHSLGARLLVWRDGLPATYEPLLPLRPFGAHVPALPALAADLSLLSGVPPARGVLLVHQAAQGLVVVALYAFLRRRPEPAVAALGAVLAVAIARLPAALLAFGDGGPILAVAFALAVAAWLAPGGSGNGSRASTVAAGTFLGAAALAQPALALAAAVTMGVRLRAWRDPAARARLSLALGIALVLAAPLLWRLAGTVWTGGAGLPPAAAGSSGASLAVALAVLIAVPWLVRRWWPSRSRPATLGLVALSLAAIWCARAEWLDRAAGNAPGPVDRAAIDRLAAETRPLDTICIEPDSAGLWIPALAGRAVRPSWVAFLYRDQLRAATPRPCAVTFAGFTEVQAGP